MTFRGIITVSKAFWFAMLVPPIFAANMETAVKAEEDFQFVGLSVPSCAISVESGEAKETDCCMEQCTEPASQGIGENYPPGQNHDQRTPEVAPFSEAFRRNCS